MTVEEIIALCMETFPNIIEGASITQEDRMVRFHLSDGSFLYVFVGKSGRYSFHWQKKDQALRFNNAPHFDSIETAPHHFHDANGTVRASPITGVTPENIQAIFQFIHLRLKE